MAVVLTPLSDADSETVETLLDAAFGADRRGRTAYRLREGAVAIPELSFAAWDGERLVGTLQSWPVALRTADGSETLVMVGPVAVVPDQQTQGIGKALMAALIDAAEATGADALIMVGDPEYYQRFGFTAEQTGSWRIDGPYEQRRLLARLRRGVAREGELQPWHSRESENPPAFETAA